MKPVFFILATFLIYCGGVDQASTLRPPTVANGEIDLTGWDFEKNGPVKLDGNWLFSRNKFIKPGSWDEIKDQVTDTKLVPSKWGNNSTNNVNPESDPIRFASYAVKLKGLPGEDLGFLIRDLYTSGHLFFLDEAGKVYSQAHQGIAASSLEQELPLLNYNLKLFPEIHKPFESHDDLVELDKVLLIHISSHHVPRGGILSSIELDHHEKIEQLVFSKIQIQAIMFGIYLILSLYHLALYLQRPKGLTSLYFSLFTMGMSLRLFSLGMAQNFGLSSLSADFHNLIVMRFLAVPLIIVSFSYFFTSLFDDNYFKRVATLMLYWGIGLGLFTTASTPFSIMSYDYLFQSHIVSCIVLIVLGLLKLSIQGNQLARIFLACVFIIGGGVINDILYTQGTIVSAFISEYTTMIFVLIQTGILSYKYTQAHSLSEHLSEKLQDEIQLQSDKLNRIQLLSQQIQSKTTLSEIERNIKNTLKGEYGIKNFIFYVLNEDKSKLYPYSISLASGGVRQLTDKLGSITINIRHADSVYAAVMRRKKALFLPRLMNVNIEPNEISIRNLLKLTSMYLIPLKVDNEVFAIFSLSDTAFDKSNDHIVKKLTKEQRIDIEQLSEFISPALYQSLQKEILETSRRELRSKNNKLEQINAIVSLVQNVNSFDDMLSRFRNILVNVYNIKSYFILIKNESLAELNFYRIFHEHAFNEQAIQDLYEGKIEIDSKSGLHSLTYRRGRSVILKRFRSFPTSPIEDKLKDALGMKAIYCIPLKSSGEVFAIFSAADFGEEIGVSRLKPAQKEEIEQILALLASSLNQALQKDKLIKSKEDVEKAQDIAMKAKNDAAIGQLAAHLAHEVNNPLNYITTGNNVQTDSFKEYHTIILDALKTDDGENKDFEQKLISIHEVFSRGTELTNEGQERIAKVVSEMRAITGIDGLNLTNFDIVPIINEEMVYSLHRNQVKIGEQSIRVTGTDQPIQILSNSHILARAIRTMISNCIHFAREHRGNEGVVTIDCKMSDSMLFIDIGNNSYSIKNANLDDLFDLEKSQAYGTELIGIAMINELLQKINCNLKLADHGRESGKVVFQLQIPLETKENAKYES